MVGVPNLSTSVSSCLFSFSLSVTNPLNRIDQVLKASNGCFLMKLQISTFCSFYTWVSQAPLEGNWSGFRCSIWSSLRNSYVFNAFFWHPFCIRPNTVIWLRTIVFFERVCPYKHSNTSSTFNMAFFFKLQKVLLKLWEKLIVLCCKYTVLRVSVTEVTLR